MTKLNSTTTKEFMEDIMGLVKTFGFDNCDAAGALQGMVDYYLNQEGIPKKSFYEEILKNQA